MIIKSSKFGNTGGMRRLSSKNSENMPRFSNLNKAINSKNNETLSQDGGNVNLLNQNSNYSNVGSNSVMASN